MEEVRKILQNPIVRNGLRIVAPEIGVGIDLVLLVADVLFASNEPGVQQLLAVIDRQLAGILEQLVEVRTEAQKQELEIRAHTLLGILNDWGKIA